MISIARLLTQYLEQYPDETSALSRLSALVAQSTTPQELIDRTNFQGHVTASGFVLSADGSTTLLVHHRRLEIYVQPGGHMEMTEASPLDGALREVREETGISTVRYIPAFVDAAIPFDIDSHYIPPNAKRSEPEHWHHDFRYAFQCVDDARLTLALDEVVEARWVSLHELGDYPTLERVAAKLNALDTRDLV